MRESANLFPSLEQQIPLAEMTDPNSSDTAPESRRWLSVWPEIRTMPGTSFLIPTTCLTKRFKLRAVRKQSPMGMHPSHEFESQSVGLDFPPQSRALVDLSFQRLLDAFIKVSISWDWNTAYSCCWSGLKFWLSWVSTSGWPPVMLALVTHGTPARSDSPSWNSSVCWVISIVCCMITSIGVGSGRRAKLLCNDAGPLSGLSLTS